MKKSAPSSRVFILALPDDMGQPYAEALSETGSQLRWFSNCKSLLAAAITKPPMAVVVDLDAIDWGLIDFSESLKRSFPSSELVALSSTDSSRLAMHCLRSGFSDFLLKPISPEQLAWTVQHCHQRRNIVQTWHDPNSRLLRSLIQISSRTSAALVRIETLKYLQEHFGGTGATWHSAPKRAALKPGVYRSTSTGLRRVVLRCEEDAPIAISGIPGRVRRRQMQEAALLVAHGELSLRHLKKLDQVKLQTFVDDLTGLYNSRYLKFCLTNTVAKCRRSGASFSVLFIDIDRFKSVNDTYGHTVGSDLLVALARSLKNSLRGKDPVFRYGGDEFVVVLQETALEKAYEIAERLRIHIERKTFHVRGHSLRLTVSIGIAVYPDHAPEHQTLLRLADEAMYSAKKHNRNAVRLALGTELPPAIAPTDETPAKREL